MKFEKKKEIKKEVYLHLVIMMKTQQVLIMLISIFTFWS